MEDDQDREERDMIERKFIESLPYDIPTFDNWHSLADFYHPLKAGSIDGTDLVPHDHGVVRAIRARYKPNKKVVGDPTKTLMVRHLARSTLEATVSAAFSKYGDLEKCRLVRDIITGISRGYAFVEFKHERDAYKAWHDAKGIIIDGSSIIVDFEVERTLPGWIPRRFGGGFGGRKESGQLRFGGCERPFRRPIPVDSIQLGTKGKSQFDRGRNLNNKRDHRYVEGRSRSNSFRNNYNDDRDESSKRHRR